MTTGNFIAFKIHYDSKKTNKSVPALLKKAEAESHKKSKKPRKELLLLMPPVFPSDFKLTQEFSTAFELMEQSGKHLYITGNAGTGKSTLLHYFKKQTRKEVVILAPTGIAAVNIGGATIHSFFRFPTRFITLDDIKKIRGKADMFAALATLIIDEASMVLADMMDAIDASLRLNRNQPYEPFGGVQLILIGDLFQLPPVIEQDLEEYFADNYMTPYFFSAKVFSEVHLQKVELQRVFRQSDPEFIRLLNKVRTNELEKSDLELINQRFQSSVKLQPSRSRNHSDQHERSCLGNQPSTALRAADEGIYFRRNYRR